MWKHTEALYLPATKEKQSEQVVLLHCFSNTSVLLLLGTGQWGKDNIHNADTNQWDKDTDVLCFMLKNWTACLLAHWDLIFAELQDVLQNYKMFLKYLLFLAVLGAGCQKRRPHTDLTLTEHSFSQSWGAKGWNLDALAEEGRSWYASRNTGEYSETAALWLVWEK